MLLILSDNKSTAETVCNIFYYLGVLSYAESYGTVKAEDINQSAAVLMLHYGTPQSSGFLDLMRDYLTDKPLFACESGTDSSDRTELKIHRFASDLSFPEIAAELIAGELSCLGKYEAAGVCADRKNVYATVDGKELRLTKTELMIVRYLCATYPLRQRAERIRSFCWRSARMPEISNVRTHISVINSKAKREIGRHLISCGIKCGYVLMD